MSSIPNETYICSSDLEMLQSVLCDIGFNQNALVVDSKLYNAAARKIMTLFVNGMTNPADLEKEMLFYFGKQKPSLQTSVPDLPRYAIQGMPRRVSSH